MRIQILILGLTGVTVKIPGPAPLWYHLEYYLCFGCETQGGI